MRLGNKLQNIPLRLGKKIPVFIVILAFIFSLFGQVAGIPRAQAAELPACTNGLASQKGVCGPQEVYATTEEDDSWSTWFAVKLSDIIYVFTVGLGSLVAYVAAIFFNLAIFMSLTSTAYAMDFVSQGWTMVRDLANMMFIFILIYIAVTIMLSADTGKTMQTLVRVIAIALIINFSFFFARVVIDGGNILAIQFYNGIDAPALSESLENQGPVVNVAGSIPKAITGASKDAKDLTAPIMGAISVQNILNTKSFQEFSSTNGFITKVTTLSFVYICVGIVFGLLAAMFFTVGIKFISRIVVLWLVIIAAPLALVLKAIPNSTAEKYFKQWLNALITYSLYPAIFLFLFIIIANFAYALAGCQVNSTTSCASSITGQIFSDINNSGGATGPAYGVSIIANVGIRLGFIMVLLYIALQASNVVSSWGGALAQKVTARPDKWAASISGVARRVPTFFPRTAARAIGGTSARAGGALLARPISAIGTDLDRTLKRSNWANREGILGAIGTRLRKNVAQPMSKATLLGSMTKSDVEKKWKAESDERIFNRKTNEDRKAAEETANKVDANTASGKTPEEGIDKVSLDRLQNLSETRMKELSISQIKTLSHVFTENQMKVVEKLEKMSEQDKEIARKNFDTSSPHSAVRQAQKAVEELRKLNAKLGGIPGLTTKIGSGAKIDGNTVKDIKSVLEEQHKLFDKAYEDARLAKNTDLMSELSEKRRSVRSAIDQDIKTLEEKRKAIRPRAEGGTTVAGGEFAAPV